MTVSRVLRNSPHVSPETRERVTRAAEKLGYQPNAQLARLMTLVRGAKGRRLQAAIGVIRDDIPEDELHDRAYQYQPAVTKRKRRTGMSRSPSHRRA